MDQIRDPSSLEAGHIAYLRGIPAAVEALDMHGMADVVNTLVVALLTEGHVLLEGNPGLGKTALVRALSSALGLGKQAVGRVQFTPDLMPADITGTQMPADDGSGRLDFSPGPVFCSLLLADEINRATPKTQSAMLEAMAEYQVTVLGKTYPLRHWRDAGRQSYRTPFMVMATQNPIDQEGTYALPEAQSDRFMFTINLSMPGADVMGRIITKALKPLDAAQQRHGAAEDPVQVAAAGARLHEIGQSVLSVGLPPLVLDHINNLVQASNQHFDQLRGIGPARVSRLRELVERRVTYLLGPRAGMALARAAVGWAAAVLVEPAQAGHATTAQTPRALAEILVPVLRHRIRISHDYAAMAAPHAEAAALDDFIRELAAACAPDGPAAGSYVGDFANFLDRARKDIRL